MAIKLTLAQFPTAFPSKVACREGAAHMYSLQHATESWNGAVVAKGDYVSLDLYNETEATEMDAKIVDVAANGNFYVEIKKDIPAAKCLIVYNPAMIEEEYNKNFQKESNFYIPANVEERAYPVREGDIWELSKDNFTGEPSVGKTITSISGKKWVIA